jgi:hypothetical protein
MCVSLQLTADMAAVAMNAACRDDSRNLAFVGDDSAR